MKLRYLLPVGLVGFAALVHCGSSSDDSTFKGNGDGGLEGSASSSSSTGGFNTSCDGPCSTSGSDDDATTGQAKCGDGNLAKTEACDDGNTTAGDGCSATCTLENGWACPTPGISCVAAQCGDGILVGTEECENPSASGGGCDASCKIVDGFDCNPTTFACITVKCGDGIISRGETCEDVATDPNNTPFDGCYNCQKDPVCTNGVCAAVCGDGQRFDQEACDDGNTRPGDGCSADCKVETGFKCTDVAGQPPATIDLPLLVRDFIGVGDTKNGSTAHTDFNMLAGTGVLGIVENNLDASGRMVLNCPNGDCNQNPGHLYTGGAARPNISTKDNFNQWYKTDPTINVPSTLTLHLKRSGTLYVWDSNDQTQNPGGQGSFFDPIGTGGWVAKGKEVEPTECNPLRNVSWTTETHFFFEYQGGEKFNFSGDDDTWVFVNGHLALDLGGLHNPLTGTVTLSDTPTATKDASFTSNINGGHNGDLLLGLTKGGIYELVMFQAERNRCGSNFKVTFDGFNKPKSACVSTCGDGVRASNEVCDDGKNDGSYNGCMPGCLARGPRCGDGTVQASEQCDDGNDINDDDCTNGCQKVGVK